MFEILGYSSGAGAIGRLGGGRWAQTLGGACKLAEAKMERSCGGGFGGGGRGGTMPRYPCSRLFRFSRDSCRRMAAPSWCRTFCASPAALCAHSPTGSQTTLPVLFPRAHQGGHCPLSGGCFCTQPPDNVWNYKYQVPEIATAGLSIRQGGGRGDQLRALWRPATREGARGDVHRAQNKRDECGP